MSAAIGGWLRAIPPTQEDVLTLQVGNQQLEGWQRVSVTRSMDAFPASFDLEVTERYPDRPAIDVKPGDPCTVSIGGDLVITGYVDRYAASISASQHTVRIQGRSKSADLVDCSAFIGSANDVQTQVPDAKALQIAQKIAKPYGVTITSLAGDGAEIKQFLINLGETCWDVIDRLLRISGFVAYDMPDGSVMFARAGTESMSSGFAIGRNVEQADVSYSMDQRFSEYEPFFLSVQMYGTNGKPLTDPHAGPIVKDEGVPRFRKRFIVSEQMDGSTPLAQKRAEWERNRRQGRSQQFNVTCDSWRDGAGKLWAPNHTAPIQADVLKLGSVNWVIAGVSYVRDENGNHASLALMPKEAFDPEPAAQFYLPPFVQDVAPHKDGAITGGTGSTVGGSQRVQA